MRIITMTMVIFSLIGTVGMAYAQDQSPIEEKRLSNETSISIVNTTGNTDTLSFAGKNDMKYQFNEKWTGSWVVGAIYNETDNKKETERYFTDFRADYIITDRWYAYGLGSWFQDKFSGFDHRIGLGPGLGYHFWMGPRHFLLLEGGLNYTYEDYTADTEDNEHFVEGRLFGKYEWMFTEKTKFSQGIQYLHSFKDGKTWKINSESALITAITDILALKISYSVLYNNDPRPNDIKNTDTILATSLVIGF